MLLLLTAWIHGAPSDRIRVYFEGEYRTASVESVRNEGVSYVSLADFAELLDIRSTYNPQNKKLVLRVGSCSIKVTAMNPFIAVDDRVYQMALPTLDISDRIYVPFALFLDTVGEVFPEKLDFDPDRETLRIVRAHTNITGIEVEEKLNGSLIRIVTSRSFSESDIATSYSRGWLNVTIFGGLLDTLRMGSDRTVGIVNRIVPFQFENSAQVSFRLNREIGDQKVFVGEGEVLISMRNAKEFDTALMNTADADRKRWLIDRIILDPGHGGKDPGCIGRQGTKEKDINLDIARRLKDLLRKRLDVEVLMTRDNDTFIGLKERTKFANSKDGKLFISIHCNANPSSRARGYSTYILGTSRTQQALDVAEAENSVIELEEDVEAYEEFENAAHILNSIAQNTHLKESEDLARMINESFKRKTTLSMFYNGIYQNIFYVLIGAAMPKVLVETAFLSNTGDERFLRVRTNRQKIAEALYDSIRLFKEKYEQGIG